MALGSTQPLTEMSTRSISWGKSGRCVRLTTLPPSCAVVMISGNLNLLELSGSLQACNGTTLPLSAAANFYTSLTFFSSMYCFDPFDPVSILSVQSQPFLLHCRYRRLLLHLITHKDTHTRQDSFGRRIGPSQRTSTCTNKINTRAATGIGSCSVFTFSVIKLATPCVRSTCQETLCRGWGEGEERERERERGENHVR